MNPSRLRVAVDARPLSHPQSGGFRTYTRALFTGLKERAEAGLNDLDLILYVDRPLTTEVERILPANVAVRILHPGRLKTDLALFARQVRQDKPDIVHGTMNYLPPFLSAPAVVTIHDAMGVKTYPWDRNTPRNLRERAINRYWYFLTLLSARTARRIITVSRGSAEELSGAVNLPADRFDVVYNGIDLPAPEPNIPRESNTLLAIASPDLRKNLDALYQALSRFRHHFGENPPRLDIVGTSERTAARAEESLRNQGITAYRLLRNLSDRDLANTFARAAVFVWPSRLEGFGMPPLEAMRCGCPVVSSCAPVMPEVLKDIPVYFSPENPEALAEQAATLLANPAERQDRSERGRQHAATFTCRRMADETTAAWKRAVEGARST